MLMTGWLSSVWNKTQSKTKQTHPLKASAALCIVQTKMREGLHWAAVTEESE